MTAAMATDEFPITVTIKRGISAPIQVEVEPVGTCFHQYEQNRFHGGSKNDKPSESDNSDDSKDGGVDKLFEDDITFLRSLDPCKWKDQDHYKVLGLQKYRYKATEEDIKKAHRHMVLKHHPDKRRGGGEEVRDGDDYFTNITKAYETLGDCIKRRSYDSIDPDFDEKVPNDKLANKDKYFDVFAPAFENNSRWSMTKHVPQLGKMDDPQEKVEKFYDFWYNFDSWREFSYLDEEDKEKGEDRDERRWIEKQNRREREVKRKEELARVRKLVDNAYKLDPRIAKFREEEKFKKGALKRARQEESKKKEEEANRERLKQEEEDRQRKEQEQDDLKLRQAREKKEREAVKKGLKTERKTMLTMSKEEDYFIVDEKDRVQAMMDIDMLCDCLALLQLKDLVGRVSETRSTKDLARKIIKQEVEDLRSGKLENITLTQKNANHNQFHNTNGNNKSKGNGNSNPTVTKPVTEKLAWSKDELQLLIKAVNLFPAGTAKRWEVVAQYLSQHGTNTTIRPSKEVLNKAKELQNSADPSKLKDAKDTMSQLTGVDKKLDKLETQGGSSAQAVASERLDTPSEMLGLNLSPWSAEEQARLEQALKTFPGNTEDRWGKIADTIQGRSKKDCMRRFKELAEMVKAKKAALQAAGVKK